MSMSETESWLEQSLDVVFSKGKIQGDGSAAFIELNIPARSDGSAYTVDGMASDQKVLLAEVLEAVRDFCENKISNDGRGVLRLTVSGCAGSGKSTWINTLVTMIRKLFNSDDAVSVFAPTGSAAFNAGGETMHRGFHLPLKIKNLDISADKNKFLLKKYGRTVVGIFDERGMIEATNLGLMKHFMQECAHGGGNKDHPWGGIPVIILVGDDYQLPSIEYGAFYSLPEVTLKPDGPKTTSAAIKARTDGFEEFRLMGEKVMYLHGEKRVNDMQEQFKRILRTVRCADEDQQDLCEADIQRLLELDINHPSFSPEEKAIIQKEATYVFANKEPRDRLNDIRLKEANTPGNPVARIQSRTLNRYGKQVVNQAHYDAERTPRTTLICKTARVALNGCNIMPPIGLYHGSLGIVHDIVFKPGESPNLGDMPAYVLVEFHQYCGPAMIPSMPKVIPIVPRKQMCRNQCCTRTYIPLSLAFGKTGHTFQGQTVGPVPDGKPENAIKKIIVDPGSRQFEGINCGLFYTLMGRPTTLGVREDKLSSAIYFDGDHFSRDRITNLTTGANGKPYRKALLRRAWVKYLKSNEVDSSRWTKEKQKEIFEWANETDISADMLTNILDKRKEDRRGKSKKTT
jgi:hypothetical protein